MLITREEAEAKVMVFLPVMKELEAMGHNPVELMFGEKPTTITEIEAVYVAINTARTKNPEWYKVTTEHLGLLMGDKPNKKKVRNPMDNEGNDLNAGQAREGPKPVTERTCRICGCTDTRACEGGCSWLLQGVCSKCITDRVPKCIDLLVDSIKELPIDSNTTDGSVIQKFLTEVTKMAEALRQ